MLGFRKVVSVTTTIKNEDKIYLIIAPVNVNQWSLECQWASVLLYPTNTEGAAVTRRAACSSKGKMLYEYRSAGQKNTVILLAHFFRNYEVRYTLF